MAGCGDEAKVTQPTEALSHRRIHPQYRIIKFARRSVEREPGQRHQRPGLGGGLLQLADGTRHAVLWRNGSLIDLAHARRAAQQRAVAGLNSAGMVVGIAETAEMDSLNEDWSCSAFFPAATGQVCRGFVWENERDDGRCPRLGGTHGFAAGVNNRGQVVGWAETPVHDQPATRATQILQFRAVMWEPKREPGSSTELPPFPGDSTSAATAINDTGPGGRHLGRVRQAVGRFSARHAVLWEERQGDETPNLGGTSWHTPMAINNQGDIVGFSNPAAPGDIVGDFSRARVPLDQGAAGMQPISAGFRETPPARP